MLRIIVHLLSLLFWFSIPLGWAREKPGEPHQYTHFDEARKNAGQNMCPYLIQGSNRVPVVCWMCHFPHGMHHSNRYTYDCCPGFKRSELVENSCVAVEPTWKNIINYLKDKGHVNTAKILVTNTGIQELTEETSSKAWTVFVPKTDLDLKNTEAAYLERDNAARMLVAKGRLYSNTFVNGHTIQNENGVALKITTYSNGLSFMECRLIWSVDHETTNGVIQFLDGVLPATSQYPTVLSRILSEPLLSNFAQALPQDVRTALGRQDSFKWYTVLAPTNQAWTAAVEKLQPGESVGDLVRTHILPRMICADAIRQKSEPVGPTLARDYIRFTLTKQGTPAVLDSCGTEIPFNRKDLMSGTGVVHVVDKVVWNMKSLGLSEALTCLAQSSGTDVARAIKEMNECDLVSRSKANIVLLPHDQAFQWLNSNNELAGTRDRMRTDRKYRCNVYAYHLLTTNRPSSRGRQGLVQEQRIKTDYIAPGGGATIVSSYYIKERDGSQLFFNGAHVKENKAIEFRNGFIYPIYTINFPPEQSIVEILRSHSDLTITTQKFTTSKVEEDIKRQNGKVLFLAPVDLGWGSRQIENDYSAGQLRKLFKLHTIPHALFGGENGFLWHSTVQTVNSLLTDRRGERIRLIIKRDVDGNTFIGHPELPESHWAMVLKWNLVGTDGMVWVIDWPIKCPDLEC